MTQGAIARWLKSEGDTVAVGEPIAEIETEKSTVELEAPVGGVLEKILAQAGAAAISVDTPIGILLTSAGSEADAPAAKSPRIAASPVARKLAQGANLELQSIPGSGPDGRIVKVDIERAREREAPRASPRVQAPSERQPQTLGQPSSSPPPSSIPFKARPLSAIRRTIARRLAAAAQTIPHIYLTIDCLVDPVLELRSALNEASPDLRVSINDVLVYAAARAMVDVPAANVSWTESAILEYQQVDVSVAVQGATGLITPIVKSAGARSLNDVSHELRELIARARAGQLEPDEYQGGTFCVTNLGMYGVRQFGAIINPPQACILALGAAEPRPVVRGGSLAVATMMTCTLSADHRAVDGAVAAQFLAAFKERVEKPLSLIV